MGLPTSTATTTTTTIITILSSQPGVKEVGKEMQHVVNAYAFYLCLYLITLRTILLSPLDMNILCAIYLW